MKNHMSDSQVAVQGKLRHQFDQKREVNLRKNSVIYFQVGLILCLLAVYGLFEMSFPVKNYSYQSLNLPPDEDAVFTSKVIIEKKADLPDTPEIKPPQKSSTLKVIEDDLELLESKPTFAEPEPMPLTISDIPDSYEVVDEIVPPFNMINVEQVPIYPGCESFKNNLDRKNCMSQKLAELIQKKFNSDLARGHNLSGVQKISVQFTIDDKGNVTDILTRAPNSLLENEAKRIIKMIPAMKPAMQREKPVRLIYQMPIIFKVENH